MKNIKCTVAYDGTDYKGFQKQKKFENTIQEKIERSLHKLYRESIRLIASGRTDSGVHATGQVFNYKVENKIPIEKIPDVINRCLPSDIRIIDAKEVNLSFHSIISAKKRMYEYKFYIGETTFPGIDRYRTKLCKHFDLDLAKQACKLLLGKINCSSFMSSGSYAKSTIKKISKCNIYFENQNSESKEGLDLLTFQIEADSFLYNMVRIIVANIVKVGYKEQTISEFKKIIDNRDRKSSGKMFPSNGLYLVKVTY